METDYLLKVPTAEDRSHNFLSDAEELHFRLQESSKIDQSKCQPITCLINAAWDQRNCAQDRKEEETDSVPTKCANRPSTAVRKHVKKISEEFTITQTNFENSRKRNAVVIHIERPKLISPRIPKSLVATHASCTKCDYLCKSVPKGVTLPIIASPENQIINRNKLSAPVSQCEPKLPQVNLSDHDEKSVEIKSKESVSTTLPSCSPKIPRSNCLGNFNNVGSPNLAKERKRCKNQCSRSPARRTSLSASSSPRLQAITLEQLKKARTLTERAIKVRF